MKIKQADFIRARWRGQSALETCRHMTLEVELNDQGDSTGNYVCILCGVSVVQGHLAA
jgi:hypothetical protein